MMKRDVLSFIVLTGVLIVILNHAPNSPQASAQDNPFSVAWADLEPITAENFGDLTRIYSVNLGEGAVSIGDSFYADEQLSVALTLFYKPQREITETVYLLQTTESDVEIIPFKDLRESIVADIDFSNTGEFLSLATFDAVELWDVNTRQQVGLIDRQKTEGLRPVAGGMYAADFHPLTDHLVTTNLDSLIEWDQALETPTVLWVYTSVYILDIDFSPSGDLVAIGDMGGVMLIDPNRPEEMVALVSGEANRSVLFNADGSVLGYISDGGFEVGLWNMATNERTIVVHPGYEKLGNDIEFNSNGQLFMSVTRNNVEFYDALTGGYLGKLDDYSSEMLSLDASSDGRVLITGHENGELIIWGVPKQSE